MMSTGMQLRSGTTTTYNGYQQKQPVSIEPLTFDGQDYIPAVGWSLSSANWVKQIDERFVNIESASWEYAYHQLNYVAETSNIWADSDELQENPDSQRYWYTEGLVNYCRYLGQWADEELSRPCTRSQSKYLEESHRWMRGIKRLAQEIYMEWSIAVGNVSTR